MPILREGPRQRAKDSPCRWSLAQPEFRAKKKASAETKLTISGKKSAHKQKSITIALM